MSERIHRDLSRRLAALERRRVTLRLATVTATSPLSISIAGADVIDGVSALDTPGALSIDDVVAVLVAGNDLLVLGKIVTA